MSEPRPGSQNQSMLPHTPQYLCHQWTPFLPCDYVPPASQWRGAALGHLREAPIQGPCCGPAWIQSSLPGSSCRHRAPPATASRLPELHDHWAHPHPAHLTSAPDLAKPQICASSGPQSSRPYWGRAVHLLLTQQSSSLTPALTQISAGSYRFLLWGTPWNTPDHLSIGHPDPQPVMPLWSPLAPVSPWTEVPSCPSFPSRTPEEGALLPLLKTILVYGRWTPRLHGRLVSCGAPSQPPPHLSLSTSWPPTPARPLGTRAPLWTYSPLSHSHLTLHATLRRLGPTLPGQVQATPSTLWGWRHSTQHWLISWQEGRLPAQGWQRGKTQHKALGEVSAPGPLQVWAWRHLICSGVLRDVRALGSGRSPETLWRPRGGRPQCTDSCQLRTHQVARVPSSDVVLDWPISPSLVQQQTSRCLLHVHWPHTLHHEILSFSSYLVQKWPVIGRGSADITRNHMCNHLWPFLYVSTCVVSFPWVALMFTAPHTTTPSLQHGNLAPACPPPQPRTLQGSLTVVSCQGLEARANLVPRFQIPTRRSSQKNLRCPRHGSPQNSGRTHARGPGMARRVTKYGRAQNQRPTTGWAKGRSSNWGGSGAKVSPATGKVNTALRGQHHSTNAYTPCTLKPVAEWESNGEETRLPGRRTPWNWHRLSSVSRAWPRQVCSA